MTEERAIEVLEIMKSQLKDFGMTAKFKGVMEMQELAIDIALKSLTEIQQYRAIGTVDECRKAREKQRGKKPVYRSIFTDGTRLLGCPVCFSRIDGGVFYCNGCGQKLDWSDTP